jgi:hypothetical protein
VQGDNLHAADVLSAALFLSLAAAIGFAALWSP